MCLSCPVLMIWFASLIPFLPLLPLFPLSFLSGLQLSIQARSEVIKRATKALRQLCEKSKKRGGEGSCDQDWKCPAGMAFDEAVAHLQQSQAHLDTLSHPFIQSLKDTQQVHPIYRILESPSLRRKSVVWIKARSQSSYKGAQSWKLHAAELSRFV